MTKRVAYFLLLAACAALLTAGAAAQNVLIKGLCKDEAGKPIRAATVEFKNLATGETVRAITGERGEYSTVDVQPGTYKIALIDSRNKQLFYIRSRRDQASLPVRHRLRAGQAAGRSGKELARRSGAAQAGRNDPTGK